MTICPKCRSTNVKAETNPAYAASGVVNQFMECLSCGQHGKLFPQVPASEVPEQQEPVGERVLEQTALGRFEFKYLLYVGLPVFVVSLLLYFLLQ